MRRKRRTLMRRPAWTAMVLAVAAVAWFGSTLIHSALHVFDVEHTHEAGSVTGHGHSHSHDAEHHGHHSHHFGHHHHHGHHHHDDERSDGERSESPGTSDGPTPLVGIVLGETVQPLLPTTIPALALVACEVSQIEAGPTESCPVANRPRHCGPRAPPRA